MSRSRTPVRLLSALALAVALGGVTATPAEAVADPLIQGVATDGKGRALLDVRAVATNAAGERVATDLSYENIDAHGHPQRGYFALHVHRGVFTVRLSKQGYEPVRLDDVRITLRHLVESLREVSLRKATTTGARGPAGVVRVGDRVRVRVSVSGRRPVGRVTVKEGGDLLGSAKLTADHEGEVRIALGRLSRGSRDLVVRYAGSTVHADSSDRLSLTVRRKQRQDRPANALPGV